SSATNVTLTIITPKKILQVPSTFSSDKIQTISFKENTMKVNIPKITQGIGSIVEINLLMNTTNPATSYTNYTGYAVYDQGSTLSSLQTNESEKTFNATVIPYLLSLYVIILSPYYFVLKSSVNKKRLNRVISELIK